MTAQRPELVSGAEIARRLNVSRERVRQWAASPKLGFPAPVARIGRSVVWEWPPVARWAEKRSTAGSEPTP
ncbi:MAG: helix-turn-helix transcriptional regulator [Acidimicrobiales bacterium]